MNEKEKERLMKKLKRKKREMKKSGADYSETKKVRRAIRKLRDDIS
jgi:hypothetical protein